MIFLIDRIELSYFYVLIYFKVWSFIFLGIGFLKILIDFSFFVFVGYWKVNSECLLVEKFIKF